MPVAIDPTALLSLVFLAVAAIAAAIAASEARKASKSSADSTKKTLEAMEKWSDTLVRPRIMVRPTRLRERVAWAKRGSRIQGVIRSSGIRVENVGSGPAINGDVYVVINGGRRVRLEDETEVGRTFNRIAQGSVSLYPSDDSKNLEKIIKDNFEGKDEMRIQVEYFDINDKKYSLTDDEQVIKIVR